jgi:hypothetical protein
LAICRWKYPPHGRRRAGCDQIILSLPHHFGHEGGRQVCAQAVRGGRVIGFVTTQAAYLDTAREVT